MKYVYMYIYIYRNIYIYIYIYFIHIVQKKKLFFVENLYLNDAFGVKYNFVVKLSLARTQSVTAVL